MSITGSDFFNNQSDAAGGVMANHGDYVTNGKPSEGLLTISASVFMDNVADSIGGALYNSDASAPSRQRPGSPNRPAIASLAVEPRRK